MVGPSNSLKIIIITIKSTFLNKVTKYITEKRQKQIMYKVLKCIHYFTPQSKRKEHIVYGKGDCTDSDSVAGTLNVSFVCYIFEC